MPNGKPFSNRTVRLVVTLVDQAVSSLSSAVLSVLVARTVSVDEFGRFALAFSLYVFFVSVTQSLGGQALLIHHSRSLTMEVVRESIVALVAISAVLSAIVLVAAGVAPGLRSVLVALAAVLPALLVQDLLRAIFNAQGRPPSMLVNDLSWLVLQIGFLYVAFSTGFTTAPGAILAWGLAAYGACLIGAVQLGRRLPGRPPHPLRFLRRYGSTTFPLATQMLTVMGSQQVVLLAINSIVDTRTVGGIRGAQTVLGPVNVLSLGITQFAVPELSRRSRSRKGYFLAAGAISTTIVVVVMLWALLWLVAPTSWGEFFLGDSWQQAKFLLLPLALYAAGIGGTTGVSCVYRGLGLTSNILRHNVVFAVVYLVTSIGGALLHGGAGAVWGMAVAAWLVAPFWWIRLATVLRDQGVH